MPNMSPNKVKMPEQDPNVRNKNLVQELSAVQKNKLWKKQLVA